MDIASIITPGNIFLAFLVIITASAIGMGVRIVPQGKNYVVQRLGQYSRTLAPGLNFLIPFIDDVAAELSTKEMLLDIPPQEVITKDNAVIITNAVAFIQVTAPDKAVYGVEDYAQAIRNLVQTNLRNIIGEIELDNALSSRDSIKTKLVMAIAESIGYWGITLKNVEIQDIKPSASMQEAMEEQAAAERSRRAKVTSAEGEKTAAVLSAEGRLEAARKDAEAKVVLAEASGKAITSITEAVGDQHLPAMFLMGEKYVAALESMSTSSNAKTIMLPADLPAAITSLLGGKQA